MRDRLLKNYSTRKGRVALFRSIHFINIESATRVCGTEGKWRIRREARQEGGGGVEEEKRLDF